MDANTDPSAYDSFAWFYHRYWGSGPNAFAVRIQPVLEERFLPLVPAGGRILDLCCGSGRLAQTLTGRGYHVTGVDGSAALLAIAREVAPQAEFIHADARTVQLSQSFDGALSTYDSLNSIMEAGELTAAFRRVHAALRRGGPFLFDLNMEEGYRARWRGSFGISADDHALIARSSYDLSTRTGTTALTMFRLQQDRWVRSDLTLYQRCYSNDEVRQALTRAGFTSIAAWDAVTDLGLQNETGRLFFLARAMSA